MNALTWFALSVKPAAEAKVRGGFAERRFEAYVPMETTWRSVSRGRRTKASRPLLRGYVFVAAPDLATLAYEAHNVGGVLAVHPFKGPRLRDEEAGVFVGAQDRASAFIAGLRTAEAAGDLDHTLPRDRKTGKVRKALQEGDAVKITGGPFFGLGGHLVRLSGERRAQIMLSLFGRQSPMEIDILKLEAA